MPPFRSFSDPSVPPVSGAYTPALRVGTFAFISGQGPFGPDGKVVQGTIKNETRLTLANVAIFPGGWYRSSRLASHPRFAK